jgi:CDP-diacylglycerol--serine O-phosphatidyltransferase
VIKFKEKSDNIRTVPFYKIIPNTVTLVGLIIGVSSLRFALQGAWESAVYCILAAMIFDGLDGRVARFLNATSHFGAELDSLCDFVNFGFCPAIIMYLWIGPSSNALTLGWFAVMLFIICMCIRLARFNTALIQKNDKADEHFFVGVPAPCGALLALMPLVLSFGPLAEYSLIDIRQYSVVTYLYIIFVAFLLPSRIPTISLKKVRIPSEYLAFTMMAIAIFFISLIMYPWYFLPLLAVVYLLSIPYCVYFSYNNTRKIEAIRTTMSSKEE